MGGLRMATRSLTKEGLSRDEDWYGNNAAVPCPVCRQIFIVSGFISKGRRVCPSCQKSSAEITEEQVTVEWPEESLGSTALLRTMEPYRQSRSTTQAGGRDCAYSEHIMPINIGPCGGGTFRTCTTSS